MDEIKWTPPELMRAEPFATDEQIEAVVKVYVDEMRARGHIVAGDVNLPHLERVARIHDVWRVAFARVMDAPPVAATPLGGDLGAMLAKLIKPAPGLSGPALRELLDAAAAVLTDFERILDSGDAGTPPNWRDYDTTCKRLRNLLP